MIYQGIRLSTDAIVAAARDEDVDVVGVSILSGAHLTVVPELVAGLRAAGVTAAVVVGGIVPDADVAALEAKGVRAVFTPKDYELAAVTGRLVELAEERRGARVGPTGG